VTVGREQTGTPVPLCACAGAGSGQERWASGPLANGGGGS